MFRPWIAAAAWALVTLGPASARAEEARPVPAPPRSHPAELPRIFAPRVTVADLDRSARFYGDGLGAAHIITTHERERVVRFASGPDLVLLQGERREGDAPLPEGAGGLIVEVADIDAAVERAVAAGGVARPYDPGKGARSLGIRVAAVRDPDGVLVVLIQHPQAD